MAEPHELVVPLPQRDALPDVDAEHEQLECNRTARENHANGGGHAHGEAIETVRRLAALTRTAAGDPCDERADDEHGHPDAQKRFEHVAHINHHPSRERELGRL